MTETFAAEGPVIEGLLRKVGRELRVALPLGLGKPVRLINALVEAACDDPSIQLEIFTALTLERPEPGTDMERRFLAPARDRLFGAYPQITYAKLLHDDRLPSNIRVTEFFFQAPNWRNVPRAQQNYISANYTHALDVLIAQKPNLVMQLLAAEGGRLSLSCNTDITSDLLALRRQNEIDFTLIGEVHPDLPFMPGPAEIDESECTALLQYDRPQYDLFSVVKQPVSLQDHAIGLHASRLIRDGGTLQIGIGQVGDALAHALRLRQRGQIAEIWAACPFAQASGFDQIAPFQDGLYAVTEMLVDGLLALFEDGIICREEMGAAIHAGFFLDSRDFYARLREMPKDRRAKIAMMPVSFTNALYGDETKKRAARRDARFVNSAMMVTLLGAVVSDGTEDGRVVSGVGGQFNFVEQAFALKGARSIITLPATREGKSGLRSNIRWSYGHVTIPRHMRDIVITEYGIADLRGKSDAATIAALVQIADSRYQQELLDAAKGNGKLPKDYSLPASVRENTPDRLQAWLRSFQPDVLPSFPFGTDFSQIEQRLLPALARLRGASRRKRELLAMMARGLRGAPAEQESDALRRMELDAPKGVRELVSALALRGALRATT